jgi:integrase
VLAAHLGTEPVLASGLAFPSPKGAAMRRSIFQRSWTAALDEAGFTDSDLAGLRFHELRHASVALAVATGAHPLAIKTRLGHASITTTLDVYGSLFPSLDRELADDLDCVLRDALAASPRPEGSNVTRLRRSAQ